VKRGFVGIALLITVLAAAAFQLVLLVAAGSIGGSEKVGEVSLHYSVAVLLSAAGLSDLKSLSIRKLVQEDRSRRCVPCAMHTSCCCW
jgi:hypothetical protein